MLAAHYTQVAGEMPDFKMNAKDLRHELLATHYDEAKLRELANGAEIEHARITKIDTVRVYAINNNVAPPVVVRVYAHTRNHKS